MSDPTGDVNASGRTPRFTKTQLKDIAALLAENVPKGTISWVAGVVLGNKYAKAAANEVGDRAAYAKKITALLNSRDKLWDALILLRQDSPLGSRLDVGLRHVLSGRSLEDTNLQAFLDTQEPFLSAARIQDTLPRVLRAVCAIGLGGPVNSIKGSGFLIGPNFVMTNYYYCVINDVSRSLRMRGSTTGLR